MRQNNLRRCQRDHCRQSPGKKTKHATLSEDQTCPAFAGLHNATTLGPAILRMLATLTNIRRRVFLIQGVIMTSRCLAVFVFLASVASAQSIVSTHSGVVNFFDGSVSIDGQTLEQKFGRFDEIKPGSELRTDQGRAEVLLTPGVLLRVDEHTAIRMVSNKLTDTRLELISGSAALDSRNAAPGAPVLIAYKDYQMRFERSGRYRFDSLPAELRVDEGEADVTSRGKTAAVQAGQVLPFSTPFTARATSQKDEDGLDRWDQDRSTSIAADNKSAAASDDLSSAMDNPPSDSYGSGYSGALAPDPVSSGYYGGSGLVAPYWLAAPGYGIGAMPMYLAVPVYRLFPIRSGIYRAPYRTYLPSRPPGVSPSRPAPRPVLHAPLTIHR